MAENFTLFWHGPFSQWHQCKFTIAEVEYNSAEQYMMAEKAKLFNDEETLAKIMSTISPRTQKSLGRKVKNFDPEIWQNNAKCIVFKGNIAKFSQNQELLDQLINTQGTTLVEASPFDRIWGIGLGPDHQNAKNRSKWRGKNWLGEILTEVREKLITDMKATKTKSEKTNE